MSYSISFLPPSQPSIPVERRSRLPRHATSESSRPASCHMSRVYLDKLSDQQKAIVKPLLARVEHWKGHCLCSFGKPLLQAKVMVSRRAVGGDGQVEDTITRQYQVFLFSNILICCRKRARPNAQGKDWALKGRVFLRNIYDVQQTGESQLCISYHGDDGSDTFVIDFARPALLARWATVLEYFRERAAEPQSIEEDPEHVEIAPPAYYSPLPAYTSSSTYGLSAPLMERHSPLNTPLSTPPLYSPSDPFLRPSASDSSTQYPCRPAMTSTLSASTITSESYDPDYSVHDDCTSLDEEASVPSTRKLDDSRLNMHAPHSYITSLADCPTVMRVVLFVTLCILLSYVSISHRNALFDNEELLNMF